MNNGRHIRARPRTTARRESTTEAQTGRAAVSTSHKANGEVVDQESESELIADARWHIPAGEEPAYVRMAAGKTYNLGNYESLRLDVSVSMPCRPSQVDEACTTVSDIVAEKFEEEARKWGVLNGG